MNFAMDSAVGAYICTYDHTETTLRALVNVSVGELTPTGELPGNLRENRKMYPSRQPWLMEGWNRTRDGYTSDRLLIKIQPEAPVDLTLL